MRDREEQRGASDLERLGGGRRRDPFGQLERCHQRLEEACDELRSGCEARDLETVEGAVGFFSHQGRRHDRDEDASFFPRIRADDALREVIARLEREHLHHEELLSKLEAMVAGLRSGEDRWAALSDLSEEISVAYRSHIDVENAVLLPRAKELLDEQAVAAISAEMESRRGR